MTYRSFIVSRLSAAFAASMLLLSCGVDDTQSKYTQGDDVQHGHPAQWVLAGHSQGALDDRQFCLQCHVDLPEDMPSSLSCRQCHFIGAPDHDVESACDACHGFSPVSPHTLGSHVTHTAADGGYSYPCELCHSVPSDAEILTHIDRTTGVVLSGADWRTAGATYTGTDTSLDAYGSCENTYCHSDGTSVFTGVVPGNSSPQWGTNIQYENELMKCLICHGGYHIIGSTNVGYIPSPAYESGNPKANSHSTLNHLTSCNACHKTTHPDALILEVNPETHANGIYDVVPDEGAGHFFEYIKDDQGRGACLNVSCHSAAIWPCYSKNRYWRFNDIVYESMCFGN